MTDLFLLGSDETLLNVLPVDDIPDSLEILGAKGTIQIVVSVLKYTNKTNDNHVSVQPKIKRDGSLTSEIIWISIYLPDVNSEQWDEFGERVLVWFGEDFNAVLGRVVSEPSPTGALNGQRSGAQIALQLINRTEVLCDILGEVRSGSRWSS